MVQTDLVLDTVQVEPGCPALPETPKYSQEDLTWIKSLPMTQCLEGRWCSADCKVILSDQLGQRLLQNAHCSAHMGICRMQDLLRYSKINIRDRQQTIVDIVSNCKACQLPNAMTNSKSPGTRLRGKKPGAYWEVDFTEVKPGKYGYKYVLVFIDTFLSRTEAFPGKHETVQVVQRSS